MRGEGGGCEGADEGADAVGGVEEAKFLGSGNQRREGLVRREMLREGGGRAAYVLCVGKRRDECVGGGVLECHSKSWKTEKMRKTR